MPSRNTFATNYEGYRYQFTGHEKDGETSYQYHGARYYEEDLARYMSVDPLAMQFHAWSPYNYVMGNPIMLIDPTGKGPTDWVSINGQMLYDSKVTDQKTATERYGSDAIYRAPGYKYTSGAGNKNELGEHGTFIQNGETRKAIDMANQSSTDLAWNTSGGVGSETPNPFLSNLRQTGNFDFNHVPIDFPETYDIAGPLGNLFAITMTALVTGGVGVELGAAGYGAKEFGGLLWRGAKAYHNTFGVNGGYVSMASNVINQTTTQLSEKGNVRLGDFDLISLGSSGFITNQTSLGSQMVQGASGTYLSYSVNGGFDGALVKNRSSNYILTSTLNGMLNPLMNKAPIISPLGNEVLTGATQGILNKTQ